MATKEKIAAVVAMLCEAHARTPTTATFRAFEVGVGDLDDQMLDRACQITLRKAERFMPSPGQFREVALTDGLGYEGRAAQAWLEFDRAVVSHGGDRSVSFDDGLINATVRTIGGWIWCTERVGDEYHVWLRKQFTDAYCRLIGTNVQASLVQPLMGRMQLHNVSIASEELERCQQRGINVGQVCRIGTEQPVLTAPSEPAQQMAVNQAERPRIDFRKPPDGLPNDRR